MHASISADRSRELKTVSIISLQLALALLVIRSFQIESRTFFQVMLLAACGFVVHALLPLRNRMAFFGAISVASVLLAFGWRDGLALLMLGSVLIGIARLPVRSLYRIALLIATGILFAMFRVQWLPAPWSVAVWPILASMFMFRIALYMYTLKHDAKRPTLVQTVAYFFMVPNVCFPLYPVIDYSTLVRTYYDRDAAQIYASGMRWITRGLLHLILYRFVYLHLVGDPTNVLNLRDLVQFMLATFLLYLRVSGQFHLIAGVLHLYGFRLPETHHLYYLASSFTDFWRRINIYWKDFMMKLVYYPSYFQLRSKGAKFGMVASTVIVFAATWILHSYQWFWLRGGFPLTPQDALFWGILGVLVVFGSLREMKRPTKRTIRQSSAWDLKLAVSRLATFISICVLWSLWSAESMAEWLTMLGAAGNVRLADLTLVAGLIIAGAVVAGKPWSLKEPDENAAGPFYSRPAVQSFAVLVAILVLGQSTFYERYTPKLAATVRSLQHSTLNATDAALQHKGYYENLDNSSRLSAQLWDVQAKKPSQWVALAQTPAYRLRNDFMRADLRPDVHITFEDRPLTTNRWGMRDRDRSQTKPAGTYRIAILGPSHVMGSGVADDETISVFLEDQLNRAAQPNGNQRYEVLNFGVAAYSLLQQLALLEDRVISFQPDAVFITDSPGLYEPTLEHVETVVQTNTPIPYPFLKQLVQKAGIEELASEGYPVPFESARSLLGLVGMRTRMPGREAHRKLLPYRDELVQWTLQRIAAVTRDNAAVPVFVALNIVADATYQLPALKDADHAGFLVFDLLNLWQNRDRASLRIAEWDEHPNAAGNRLIAQRLAELMSQHSGELRLAADNQKMALQK